MTLCAEGYPICIQYTCPKIQIQETLFRRERIGAVVQTETSRDDGMLLTCFRYRKKRILHHRDDSGMPVKFEIFNRISCSHTHLEEGQQQLDVQPTYTERLADGSEEYNRQQQHEEGCQ